KRRRNRKRKRPPDNGPSRRRPTDVIVALALPYRMDLKPIIYYLQQPGLLDGVLIGLVLSLLIAFLIALLRRQPETFEAFANDSGKVRISRHALQEQIQRCCEELDDVGRCRVAVIQRAKVLSVRIQLRLRSNAKLVGISGYLQQQV